MLQEKMHSAAEKNLLMHASEHRCMCKLCVAVTMSGLLLLPSHGQETRRSAAAAGAPAMVSVLPSLCFLLSTPPCSSHMSAHTPESEREHSRHMDLPFVYQLLDKGVTGEGTDH